MVFCAETLRNDAELVLVAVRSRGQALGRKTWKLTNVAVCTHKMAPDSRFFVGQVLRWASERLRGDRPANRRVVRHRAAIGCMIRLWIALGSEPVFAHPGKSACRDVVLTAIEQAGAVDWKQRTHDHLPLASVSRVSIPVNSVLR